MNIARKIFVNIGLTAIIPFLVFLYLLFYPAGFGTVEKKTVIVITSVLVSLGIVSLASLVRYFSRIASSLSTISNGNYNQRIEVPAPSPAEAQFTDSINQISRQLRESADELERRSLIIDRSNQELQRMSELKLQFLSEVTHELRTPLINIEKSSSMLLEQDVQPGHKELLRIINANTARLIRLIDELLDMSKLEAGMFTLKQETVEVKPIIEEAAASVERWRQSKDLKLMVSISSNLPPVLADKDRIEQVIINLLSNSIKFTPAGGTISLAAGIYFGAVPSDRKYVEISISDTGIGIAEDKIASVFEKYKTIENPGSSFAGTGLGLPIAKQIIEKHGGRIWAESRLGKGSVFGFTIPCV